MIDKILLAPYYLILKLRHFLYDSGIRKSFRSPVPSISVGNVTVGGTGKTPHTEMLIRMLKEGMEGANIAVLSRGYGRKSKGFQQVEENGRASFYGDEPMQIKKKFPDITVAVDKSRKEGTEFLSDPEKFKASKKAKKCVAPDFPAADLIILDDAFQHRKLIPDISIVLVDYNHPVSSDHLLPVGRLRDLPEKIYRADMIIVTKCPAYLDEWEKTRFAQSSGLSGYRPGECTGTAPGGKKIKLFFSTVTYDEPVPVFPEADQRYVYSKLLILFTGIADDTPLLKYLCGTYKIVRHLTFPDHHSYNKRDMHLIAGAAEQFPTALVSTTEKDSRRIADLKEEVPETLKKRMFQTPIKVKFLTSEEEELFRTSLESYLQESRSARLRKPRG